MQFYNQFRYPIKNFNGRFLNFLLNNFLFIKIKKIIFYPFSFVKLKSDIKDVVFLNWLVPNEKVKHLIPEHVKLKSYNGQVLFTALTYKHGNFRPTFLNTFKIFFGSPLQSNWRLYVENNRDFQINESAVFFVKNIVSSLTYTLGSRTVSNILQTHLPETFEHTVSSRKVLTKINPGESNSPDLEINLEQIYEWRLPQNMQSVFLNVEDLLSTICNQDFAICSQPEKDKYSIGKINLKFEHVDIHPLVIKSFKSFWLNEIVADSECFAFVIKKLNSLTLGEKIITRK